MTDIGIDKWGKVFMAELQSQAITEINTFYGKFTGTLIDNELASFNIFNTQIFKNTHGEITIGELIEINGKKTKPANC